MQTTNDQAADGGAAFPVASHGGTFNQGMTLRDYFAGQALAGISAHFAGAKEKMGETAAQAHARWSYNVADAMLAARGGK